MITFFRSIWVGGSRWRRLTKRQIPQGLEGEWLLHLLVKSQRLCLLVLFDDAISCVWERKEKLLLEGSSSFWFSSLTNRLSLPTSRVHQGIQCPLEESAAYKPEGTMEKKNSKAKMHIPGTVSTAEAQKMQESMERKWIRIQKKVRHHLLLHPSVLC